MTRWLTRKNFHLIPNGRSRPVAKISIWLALVPSALVGNTANAREMSVHGTGRAIDVMIPPVRRGVANAAVGDPIAHWLIRNASDVG